MIIRFGYVAMSDIVENASPSKTMTATSFMKLEDRDAALRKLERIAETNIHNCLRLLKHNRAHDIHLFRLSSRLIPLVGHKSTTGWEPMHVLKPAFHQLGEYANQHGMRLSFHPDHFTVLTSPKQDVVANSLRVLEFHVDMFEAMGLDEKAKLVMHIGGSYGQKEKAIERFLERMNTEVSDRVRNRLTLENDDKTYTALETLQVCEKLEIPMVLDIHHQLVNHQGEKLGEIWPRVARLWEGTGLPPKIHASSPKSESDPRGHADYVKTKDLLPFFKAVHDTTPELDEIHVMLEAKKKDRALFRLMEQLPTLQGIERVDQAAVRLT